MRSGKAIALLAVCLLGGCATPAPQIVRVVPPAALLQTCAEPAGGVKTNGELADYLLALKSALSGCNLQLTALQQWAKDSQ